MRRPIKLYQSVRKAVTGVLAELLATELIALVPAPADQANDPLQALIIDSWFDPYLGVVSLVRIMSGSVTTGDKIRVMSTGRDHLVDQVGIFTPKQKKLPSLQVGEVGFIVAGIKQIDGVPVGDTITLARQQAADALPGFQQVKPQVYAGLFPISADDYVALRESLAKLTLNDASLFYEPETSTALGFGFRCGFLGMLHMEIIQERLEREYQLDLITTAPTVVYEIQGSDGQVSHIDSPSQLPAPNKLKAIAEPIADVNILVPNDYLGAVITLCVERRGIQKNMQYVGNQVSLHFQVPLSEVVLDFFDRLKSVTRGYASLDYSFHHFEVADLVRLDILINSERVDALAAIVHRTVSMTRGRELAERLKELIPRQMFDVAIQAAIGGKIIARTTVKALRKNVTAKCYGGDISRKKKLLEKQKAGKKRMKQVGRVSIPQDAFLAILKVKD